MRWLRIHAGSQHHCWCTRNCIGKIMNRCLTSLMSLHLFRTASKPASHLHSYEPAVFTHFLFDPHGFLLAAHSSMSSHAVLPSPIKPSRQVQLYPSSTLRQSAFSWQLNLFYLNFTDLKIQYIIIYIFYHKLSTRLVF